MIDEVNNAKPWWLLSRRAVNFLGFLACASMLGFGYVIQYIWGLEPCPMCIMQRIAILATGIVFLLAALHNPQAGGAKIWGILVLLVAGIGASISTRHVYLQYFLPEDAELACGMSLDYMMEVFTLTETLQMALQGTGDCTEVVWTFLGLSIPSWTLVCFIVLGVVGVTRNWMRA